MGRDTVQLETVVSTISQEYLLEFTSEYGISEDLHPELPGPEERIVDFPEGKQETREKHPSMLYQAFGFPKKLKQLILLGGREDMDLFNLICAPNPTKVKTGTRPRAAHEVPLLTVTASRVIEMEDPVAATDSSGVLYHRKAGLAEEIAATGPLVIKERRKRGNDGVDMNAPPNVLIRDHADSQPTQSTIGGKSLAAMRIGMGSTCPVPTSRDTPVDVSDPDPLSFANPQSSKGAAVAGDPESENASFTSMVGSSESIYQSEWGVTNGCRLDAPEACQDMVDHIAPPGYFSELRHLHNDDFLKQYNINLARQVAMGSQLRLSAAGGRDRYEKDRGGQEHRTGKEVENLCALFSDLQVSNDQLSQQVSTLQAQVTGEEKLKATFKEFKQYENDRVEKRCAEMDARLDALSIDFDEELYPHMLTAITGRRWVIRHGLRLAVMKCGESTELRQEFADVVSAGIAKGMSEGLKYGVEHGKANLDLEAMEAYDPEADAKYVAALHALRDLKYPMWIRELRPSSSQLKIPVYPEVRDPKDPLAFKEEILLADAIAANVSRAEKKKKCQVVCRTHGVGFAHHARSDGVPVSVPTVALQSLAILLADAATQTETSEDGASHYQA
uniref:Transposase (Putative), gypsy type n=1 Tax=Tanacetum cinerariifolium TaxID=118510 RepID=A0A699GJR7_TANCI|nr:hypothetical protein [Tanacetum cinerariifolium]